jgi:pyruvate/2-oxoglutarate dehydrogenase complex dihydrolipoamide dehydrogenase (E3) component
MLAHKATHEGKVAAQVIAGQKSFFDARTIPSVAYTDPEIAWCGLTEEQAKEQGVEYEKGAFPWAASGRALSMGASNGLTKVLFDKETKRVIGAGIVGKNAGELIAEAVLALEMGADAEDLRRAVFDAGLVNRIVTHLAPDAVLPIGHPAQGKGPVDGKPAVYVCVGETCGLPIIDAELLREELAQL